MRSAAALFACAFLLTACESIGDLTSDAFDPGSAMQSKFTLDSADCAAAAGRRRDYTLPGITGTHVERHEIFNGAMTACMQAKGYVRRDWSPNIAVPYSIDPFPG
jgi:hypothetical protein